ncbi:erythromycin esterase family protein [Nannocystis sp. ILAH1]|uniref:erythromycin esterase family protein n=1 Tax=Nannocystis sp. ILAH1 TaxID=2996789 RepID=UPI0022701223|nr:erythromycin esterase family protein [Nannocystis sp. ILAH1]MCY0992527.1 erythromycin esterase family protein [Nannocystis sp. ILAH1]
MTKLRRSIAAVCLGGATLAACTPWRDEAHTWAPEQRAISRELDAQARAIVDGDGALDVEPVWAMTRGARVIAVGEPGRGLGLFHRIMHAMVERAAAEAAPLVVALDVCFVDGLELDAWARGAWDPPDPARFDPHAFDAAGAYRPLLAWIREHNQSAAPGRAIQIAGVDGCLDPRALEPLAAYFVDLDPEFAAKVPELLAPMRMLQVPSRRTPAHLAEARGGLAELRARLLARREAQVAAHGAASHEVALRLVWLAERSVDALGDTGTTPRALRGQVMADTVVWLAEQRPGARVVVLADNEDIDRASPVDMGRRLGERFGADYAVVHTTFDGTNYLAQRQLMWAPPGTLEAALRPSSRGYALDVQAAAAGQGSLARYLRAEHWTRAYADGLFDQARPGWSTVVPQRDYDVLVHIAFAAQVPYFDPGTFGSRYRFQRNVSRARWQAAAGWPAAR